jgi:hypothetical protein
VVSVELGGHPSVTLAGAQHVERVARAGGEQTPAPGPARSRMRAAVGQLSAAGAGGDEGERSLDDLLVEQIVEKEWCQLGAWSRYERLAPQPELLVEAV